MKIYLLLFFITILSNTYADAWDNLSREEAKATVEFLEKNPFIFDYCDCCDYSGKYAAQVFLMKVVSTKIVSCEWNPGDFSIIAKVEIIARIPYTEDGPDIKNPVKLHDIKDDYTIYMNYTWGFNAGTKLAVPLFDVIPYDYYGEASPCRNYTPYPNPYTTNCMIGHKDYIDWYRKNVTQ